MHTLEQLGDVYRIEVPGGWLYLYEESQREGGLHGPVFVPKPDEHACRPLWGPVGMVDSAPCSVCGKLVDMRLIPAAREHERARELIRCSTAAGRHVWKASALDGMSDGWCGACAMKAQDLVDAVAAVLLK